MVHILADLDPLRLQGDIIQVGLLKLSLANRAVAMGAEPVCDALLAKEVAADCQDADCECRLADDACSLVVGAGLHLFQMQYCASLFG